LTEIHIAWPDGNPLCAVTEQHLDQCPSRHHDRQPDPGCQSTINISPSTGQRYWIGAELEGHISAHTVGLPCHCRALCQASRPKQITLGQGGVADCGLTISSLPNGGNGNR